MKTMQNNDNNTSDDDYVNNNNIDNNLNDKNNDDNESTRGEVKMNSFRVGWSQKWTKLQEATG